MDIDFPIPIINIVTFFYSPQNKINFTQFNQDVSETF